MDTNQTEQQRVEEIRRWLSSYGRTLFAGLLAGLLALAGIRYYFNHLNETAVAASDVYQQMLYNIEKDRAQAITQAKRLTADFSATSYAALGALYSARFAVEDGDLEGATGWLQWALDHPLDHSFRRVVQLRMAKVLLAREMYDAALALLEDAGSDAFTVEFLELKGDLYSAMKKPPEAKAAYASALENAQPGIPQIRNLIQLKLDNLGT